MGIDRCERVRETVMREQEREWRREVKGIGGHKSPQWCPGTLGTCCLSLTLTHFQAQMKGFVLLWFSALISHPHISSGTQFTSIGFSFDAEDRYLAIWKFGGDWWESARKNWKTSLEGELCAWLKYVSWRFCVRLSLLRSTVYTLTYLDVCFCCLCVRLCVRTSLLSHFIRYTCTSSSATNSTLTS